MLFKSSKHSYKKTFRLPRRFTIFRHITTGQFQLSTWNDVVNRSD